MGKIETLECHGVVEWGWFILRPKDIILIVFKHRRDSSRVAKFKGKVG